MDKEEKREYDKKYYHKNRDKIRAQKKIYNQIPKNKLRKLKINREYRTKYREQYLSYCRNYHLRTKFGIETTDYEKLLLKQDGRCAICGLLANMQKNPLSVDHCHNTGKIRGLLCTSCNTFLGLFEKHKDCLDKFRNYVLTH